MRAPVLATLRLVFVAYWFLTSAYLFFCFDPFTWTQVIQFHLIPGEAAFAGIHSMLFWPVQLAALATLLPYRAESRRGIWIWATLTAGGGIALAVHPLLSAARNDTSSFFAAFASLSPIVVLSALDLAEKGKTFRPLKSVDNPTRLLWASLCAGLIVWGTHGARAWQAAPLPRGLLWRTETQSLLLHLVAGAGTSLVLLLLTGLLRRITDSLLAEAALATAILGTGIVATVDRLMLPAISFTGTPALAYAAAVGLSLALALLGCGLRLGSSGSGFDVLLRPLALGGGRVGRWLVPAVCVVLSVEVSHLDWNFLGAQTIALVLWVSAFGAAHLSTRVGREGSLVGLGASLLLCCVLLSGWWSFSARALAPVAGEPTAKYAAVDGAFRLLSATSGRAESSDDSAFYDFLAKRTNLAGSLTIEPLEVELSPGFQPSAGGKPNIFVFVMDSLRRDYLSPFNPAVTFTPRLGAFAKESDAFSNAFTHYGATGLSEPSIWVGGMMPHKQYITPFAPLNALQKLVDRERYREYISVDSILQVVVHGGPQVTPLDEGIQNKDYDFCHTLKELTGRLDSRPASEPVFAYTQPQDVHISRITREGTKVLAGDTTNYAGFYGPYASRIRRFDACFGDFIDALREKGLYDNSIVIFTADHGDSLGEEGRWGHAYTVYPEVMRIPLLVHVPPRLRQGLQTDTADCAFSTDLTPTLYALLGHPPTLGPPTFGVPLYGTSAPQPRHADPQLVVSSYGPVYGLLEDSGRHFYIADAVNFVDEAFDLADTGTGTRVPVEADERADAQRRIESAVELLHSQYRVPPL